MRGESARDLRAIVLWTDWSRPQGLREVWRAGAEVESTGGMDTPAKTAEDIIGIVPHTLGYTPAHSLVAILVVTDGHGAQSCATTLRVDFDLERAAATAAEGGEWLCELVCRACRPSGVFLVLYDDEYAPDEEYVFVGPDDLVTRGDAEYSEMRRSLIRAATDEMARALGRAGIDTLSAWWVSDGRFGRIDDRDDPGTDLAAAQSSACATELVSTGSAPAEGPSDLIVLPADAAERAAFFTDEPSEPTTMTQAFDILGEVYPGLLAQRGRTEAFDREELTALMTPRVVRALDRILAEKWSRDALEMILGFDHPDFLPRRVCRAQPGELVQWARRAGKSRAAADQMIGLSDRAPTPYDVLLAIAFLRSYVPWSSPRTLSTAYAVIAWFEWSLGGSTMAEQYGLAALAVDERNSLAELLVSAVGHGYLPRWLMTRAPF